MLGRCDHVVKIPTKFSVNVAMAGALVMYDRLRMTGGFPARPLHEGGDPIDGPAHIHGAPKTRAPKVESWAAYEAAPPPVHPRQLAGFMGGAEDTD
jgi:hypothetical protein